MGTPANEPGVTGALLETKFHQPRWRPDGVARPELVERIQAAVRAKLTLLSAPPGFGKTTLVAEWLASKPVPERSVAWVSLDEADNRPATFWTYLLTSLQKVSPGVGGSSLVLLQSPQAPPVQTLLATLLNELAELPRELILVLDDYHVIDAAEIHDGMAFLLEHLAPQVHVMIISRSDPPVPLARLRARGDLAEIRAADLRFTAGESEAFLNRTMGLDLSLQHVGALEVRTEGWIAALQLAALSLRGRVDVADFIGSFQGDDRYIVDYLVEEVLRRQPEHIRSFLLQTSVLDRLSAPLCDAVTAQSRGKEVLEALERGNLFLIPLDGKRQWFRYHHLFADVLRTHLAEELPAQVPVLHKRASEWYALSGQTPRAIQHALAANDLIRAAGLVEMEAQAIVRSHQLARLIEWLQPIPDELIRSMPVLSAYYAMALQGVGAIEAAASRLRDAEAWLNRTESSSGPTADVAGMLVFDHVSFDNLRARIALAQGYQAMAAGDPAGTILSAERGLALLADDDHHWQGTGALLLGRAHWANGDLRAAQRFDADGRARMERAGDVHRTVTAAYFGAEMLKARGRLNEARKLYERSLELATTDERAPMAGVASLHFGLSELYCEQNDLERATQHLERGDALADSAAIPATAYRRCLAYARLRRTDGDLASALDALEEGERLYVRGAVPDVRPAAAAKARLWITQGRLADAAEWADAETLRPDDEPVYAREFHHITLARLLIAQAATHEDEQALQGARRLLERLGHAAETGGRTGTLIEILVLQSLVEQLRGTGEAALLPLSRALVLAAPEGYVRVFVDEGEPIRNLLGRALAGDTGEYARRLLAVLDAVDAPVTGPGLNLAGLAEPLTARETEVLRLVAAGMRNQEIADHLVISLPTVKRHIANTYGKLGVGHRTEAVARANELHLLEAPR